MDCTLSDFMSSPLVAWVRSFETDGGKSLSFSALTDGVFLYDVMIYLSSQNDWFRSEENFALNRCPDNFQSRLHNLSLLTCCITSFYKEFLNQTLLAEIPDLVLMSKNVENAETIEEVRKMLLLVLGCAVQSPRREDVISGIKSLSIDAQHAIVDCIQQVTDNPETAWPFEWNSFSGVAEENVSKAYSFLVSHCARLVCERDKHRQKLIKLLTSDDASTLQHDENVHHLALQIAEAKAQIRKLRQERDEKSENVSEMREEIEDFKATVAKLRQENMDLVQESRSSRALMDELDVLRDRTLKVDALESEVSRFKEKMSDIEFYKSRVDELRDDNKILLETKEMLEDQLASARIRADQVLELENNLTATKQQLNSLNMERDADRERWKELLDENCELGLTHRNSLSENVNLNAQMENLKLRSSQSNTASFDSDLIGDAKSRVLKLQLENQRLEMEVDRLSRENKSNLRVQIDDLKQDNERITAKLSSLQQTNKRDKCDLLESRQNVINKEKEVKKLRELIEAIKNNAQRQTDELQNENSHLQDLLESLRERQKKTTKDQLKDVEIQNKDLTNANLQLQSQVKRLEHEKQQLNKLTERLRESAEKLLEVELQKNEIEKENRELQNKISTLKENCENFDKMEENYSNLKEEFVKVSKALDNAKVNLSKLETVQCEKDKFKVDVEKLKKSLEKLKSTKESLVHVEAEKEQLSNKVRDLMRQLEQVKIEIGKKDRVEVELLDSKNVLEKLKRTVDCLQNKLVTAEKEKGEIENENTKLHRTVEMLKLSTKRLNDMENELSAVEANNDRLERENRSFKKESERLRSLVELKDRLVEENSQEIDKIRRENKRLNKESKNIKNHEESFRVIEQQKNELEEQLILERKTLTDLREDLVAEKVKSQQLSNQLESIQSDLSEIGVNSHNLKQSAAECKNKERYQALETMLEETLKTSIEVREEKIRSLQSRLSDTSRRNQELKQQLLEVRSDYDCLLQRTEEGDVSSLDSLKEIVRIKESLRKTQEEKFDLESDLISLTTQNGNFRDQLSSLQSQVTSLSHQNATVSQLNATLQGDNAKLQVENATFHSQSASLIAQNSALRTSVTQLTERKDMLTESTDEQNQKLEQLISDHESLQKLHEQLNQEYEVLTREHNTLKTAQKSLKCEFKTLKEKEDSLLNNENELTHMREALRAERENLKNDTASLALVRAEHSKLKDDFRNLLTSNEKVRNEYKNLLLEFKTLKPENSSLKLRVLELGGELNETKDRMAELGVEATKLANKCQVLETANESLEENRRGLMSQVTLLLTQYHDLLTQTLDDKQQFHQEEKIFTDKVNDLKRQKEKLEEKIMEQYRKMDNSQHKKKGFSLVRRMRKAGSDLINKVPRTSRSRSRSRYDIDDSSSVGSSPTHDSLDSGSDTRRSSPHLPFSSLESSTAAARITPISRSRITPISRSDSNLTRNGEVLYGNTNSSSDDTTSGPQQFELADINESNELVRAGSRRGLYLSKSTDSKCQVNHNRSTPLSQSCSTHLSQNCSVHSSQSCSTHSILNCSTHSSQSSSTSLSQSCSTPLPQSCSTHSLHTLKCSSVNHSTRSLVDEDVRASGDNFTSKSAILCGSTTTLCGASAIACGPQSTPKLGNTISHSSSNGNISRSETPRLPPRMDHSSAPQLPPRKTSFHQPSLESDRLSITSQNCTVVPENRATVFKDCMPVSDDFHNQNSSLDVSLNHLSGKEIPRDNSTWYEYGCV